jgi:thiol-disulfide isomerase/thioredoxin
MNRSLNGWLFAAFLAACPGVLMFLRPPVQASELLEPDRSPPAPEFTSRAASDWINSPPLRLADLRGKVVLLDVWTFGCWNCYRSFPWLNDLETRLEPRGLRVVGIHSPEFEHERDPAAVKRKMGEFRLEHPVMVDNDFRYWNALGNRYWPAYYLVDKEGRLRARFFGETHRGDPQARRIEASLERLLAE